MKSRMQFHITTSTFRDRILVIFESIDFAGLIYLHCDHSLFGGDTIPVPSISVETSPNH
jgi:hypothetical protein